MSKQVNKKKNTNQQKDSTDNLKAYTGAQGFLYRIPYWVKAILLKYWWYGAVCFFFGFGLGLTGYWYAFAGGIVGGCLYDIIVKNICIAMESSKRETKYYIMCEKKKYYSFPINVIYNLAVFYASVTLIALIHATGVSWLSYFGDEPFSMALVVLFVDELCLLIKFSILAIIENIQKGKNKKITNDVVVDTTKEDVNKEN